MIHRCIGLVIPARLSEAVTVETVDVRHGTLQVILGGWRPALHEVTGTFTLVLATIPAAPVLTSVLHSSFTSPD